MQSNVLSSNDQSIHTAIPVVVNDIPEDFHSPFKLQVVIHRAENLPIADYTTSDPYVVIAIGERIEGRTKIIYRNHRAPVWEESFQIKLLQRNSVLKLKVYDHDSHKDDDLLGITAIDLLEIPLDTNIQKKYFLSGVGGYNCKASRLDVSVLVRSNDSVIKIVPDRDITNITEDVEEIVTTVLTIMDEESPAFKPTHSITESMKKILSKDNKVQYLSEELIHDILVDVTSLTTQSSDIPINNSIFNRHSLRIMDASKTIFDSRECYRHPPIGKNMIQLNLNENDSKYVLMRFNNRFASWVGARWLQLLFDIWSGKLKVKGKTASEAIPYWASNRSYTFTSTVTLSDGRSFTGRCIAKFDSPFEFKIQEETINLMGMYSMVLAYDSSLPKAYILSMEVLSFSMTGEYSQEIQKKLQEADIPSITGFGVRRNIRKFGRTLRGSVAGVLKGGKEATMFTASSIAAGPLNVMSTAHDSIVSVGKGIKSTVKTTNFLKTDEFYLLFKFDGFTQKILPNELMYLDMNEDSFNQRIPTASSHRRLSVNVNDSEIRKKAFTSSPSESSIASILPSRNRIKDSIAVALCKGKDVNNHVVVGYTSMTTSHLDEHLNKTCQIPLDSDLGYSVTLLHCSELPKADRLVSSGNMYCKIRFVDQEGKASTIRQQEVKTPSVEPSANPNWKEFNAILKVQDHFELINYIRIDVIVDDYSSKVTIGNAYIPLRYFNLKSTELSFPLTSLREKGVNSIVPRSTSVNFLGEITVRIQRIEESAEKLSTMILRPTLLESNVFNTRWFTECVVSGLVDSDSIKDVESFSLMPSMECLELILDPNLNFDISGRGSSDSLPILQQSSQKVNTHTKLSLEVEIVVFENQRRQYYFPFDWAKQAYTRPDFSDLSYATDYYFNANLIRTANPPEGFTWIQDSEWVIDKTYRNTDDQGWCYGHSFSRILADYNAGKSITKPHGMQSRRRKWVRKAVASATFDVYGPITLQALNNFAYANKRPEAASDKNSRIKIAGEKASPIKPLVDTSAINETMMHEILNHPINLWRYDMQLKYPNAVVSSCQERATYNGKVLIPWEQILNTTVITPSILTISVQVHRFFADTSKNKCFYRPADIEMFVSNCPAAELKSLIDERKWFSKFKVTIREIVSTGNSLGIDLTRISFGTDGGKDDDHKEKHDEAVEDEGPPETEELSLGSLLIADLDEYSIALDKQVRKLDEVLSLHYDAKVELEKSIIVRRECRLRLYMAALFAVGLMGSHNFEEASIRGMMQKDFKRSLLINHESDVQTANNRIEYFLDTAEKRIRDAVLCGWNYRGGQLEKCLEKLANGYFVEIVGLMGSFFEGGGSVTEVKGLNSKVELITTYLKHNDRLAVIIDHALRPYELHAEPAALLSLFLDFDILVSWYTSVLLIEMRSRVDNTLAVFKDITKDVTGRAKDYNFAVPWIPECTTGYFYTKIPDDLVDVLLTYVQFARMSKENVAPSFHANIGRMDAEVCLAYTSSFQYLSEQIEVELESKQWASSTASEDELNEYSTWLCSVANDAIRVEKYQLYLPLLGKHKETNSRAPATKEAFQELNTLALDHLSSILYTYMFHDKKDAFTDGKLFTMWKDLYLKQNDDGTSLDLIKDLLNDLSLFLEDQLSFLERISFWKLIRVMTDKMIVLYLYCFRMAYDVAAVFGIEDAEHVNSDINLMKKTFIEILENSGHSEDIDVSSSKGGSLVLDGPDIFETFKSSIQEKFVILEYCYELFLYEIGSSQLYKVLEKLNGLAKNNPRDANSIAYLAETCLALKGIKRRKGATSDTLLPHSLATPPPKASHRRSFWSSSSSVPPPVAPIIIPEVEDSNKSLDEEEEYMKEIREQSIIECIKLQIQAIRSVSGTMTTDDYDINLMAINTLNPVSRVFGASSRSETPLLQTLLFNSSLSMKNANPHAVTVAENSTKRSSGWGLSAFFGSSSNTVPATKDNKKNKNQKDNVFVAQSGKTAASLPQPPVILKTSSDIHSLAAITEDSHSHQNNSKEKNEVVPHGSYMLISNIKVENLFHVDSIRSPHPYLTIQLDTGSSSSFNMSTSAIAATEGNSADWSDMEPIKIVINTGGGEHHKKATKSMEELVITLKYQGYISDQIVGSIKIQFASYSPPVFHDRNFTITDYSQSNTAKDAAQRAKDSGRPLPVITLSISSFNF